MDRKDFIETAVSQIVEGMVADHAADATHGATLNPAVDPVGKGDPSALAQAAAGTRVSNIAFDVAVTLSKAPGPKAAPSCARRAPGPTCTRRASI